MGILDKLSGTDWDPSPPGTTRFLQLPVDTPPGGFRPSDGHGPSLDGVASTTLGLPVDAYTSSDTPEIYFDAKLKEWPPRTSTLLQLPIQPDADAPELTSEEWKDRESKPRHDSERTSDILHLPSDPEPGALIMSVPVRRKISGSKAYFQPVEGPVDSEVEELHLLVSTQRDDLVRSRKREALWMSVIVHALLFLAVRYAPGFLFKDAVLLSSNDPNKQDMTYMVMPSDLQKLKMKPKTNIISDKDRQAVARNPELQKLLEKLKEERPQPPDQPSPAPPQIAQAAPPTPQPEKTQPKLETPKTTPNPVNIFRQGSGSAESNIANAMRASAGSRGQGIGGGFENGSGHSYSPLGSNLDILSDTMGVDFDPYLRRVVEVVRMNWYNIIPEIARPPLNKKGMVAVEFVITKDGRIGGMKLSGPSGDTSLDRAAWGGITASNPFPELPKEFKGDYLSLRFRFYYNPAPGDIR